MNNSSNNNNNLKQLNHTIRQLPNLPGVYIMKDANNNIIYIGKAKNLKKRAGSYFSKTEKPAKVSQMVSNIFYLDYIITSTELDALNLESNLIRKHRPFYNILLKESKNNSFIKINIKKDYPTLEITRKVKQDGAKYFGPFFPSLSAGQIVNIISAVFMLNDFYSHTQTHKPYARIWLNYFLGKIKMPKDVVIDKQEYNNEVKKIINFLNGDLTYATNIIKEKMKINAEMQNYEEALKFRESLKLIEKLNSSVITELKQNIDIDVFAYATNDLNSVVSVLVIRNGKMIGANNFFVIDLYNNESEVLSNFILEYYQQNSTIPKEIVTKKPIDDDLLQWLSNESGIAVKNINAQRGIKRQLQNMAYSNAIDYLQSNVLESHKKWQQTIGALHLLKEDLQLKAIPTRIECFDISNLQGTEIVASMVVFVGGEPLKSYYRKFKIKTVEGKNSDTDSIKEVIARRIKNLRNTNDESFSKIPSLMVIDGGKGQLSSAMSVLKENNLNIKTIALAERIDEIFVPEQSQSIYLKRENEGLKLLQRIRDEAHRFALTYHRSLRKKTMLSSELENIAGVGKITAQNLLSHFKSINKIKTATIQDLKKVKGISTKTAQNIVNYFAEDSNWWLFVLYLLKWIFGFIIKHFLLNWIYFIM